MVFQNKTYKFMFVGVYLLVAFSPHIHKTNKLEKTVQESILIIQDTINYSTKDTTYKK